VDFLSPAYKLILFFGLGAVLQALLLIRDGWNWSGFSASLGMGLIGLVPGKHERNYSLPVHLLICIVIFTGTLAVNFRDALLPRVNEKILLAYTLTLWYAFSSLLYEPWWLYYALAGLLALPTCGVLWLAVTDAPLPVKGKMFFYSWYLLMVVLMVVFQFSFGYLKPFFSGAAAPAATAAGSLLAGMSFCYMMVNLTYIFHMFPMQGKHESREEAMKRWHGWVDMMTGRYYDSEQMSDGQAFLIVGLVGGAFAANYFYGFFSPAVAVNAGILAPLLLMPAGLDAAPHLAVSRAGYPPAGPAA
jgi:hypothetical protein